MPLNDFEQESLMNLMVALQGNVDPAMAGGFLMDTLSGMQERVDERKTMLQGLSELLTTQAMEGQTLKGANIMADVMTPRQGVPPRIEQALQSLYPSRQVPQPMPNVPSPYQGSTPSEVGAANLTAQPMQGPPSMETVRPQQSPLYQSDPMQQTQQALAEQQLAQGTMEMEQQQAQLANAPVMADAIASQAVANVGVVNPDTGQTIASTDIIPLVLSSPTFQALDPTTQQLTLQRIQELLRSQQTQTAPEAAAVPQQVLDQPPLGMRFAQYGVNGG